MRYLGLDLGTKTLGVSISDKLGIIANSLIVLRYDNEDYDYLINELKKIIDEYSVNTIVLGYPKNMNNSIGEAAKRSLKFKEILEDKLNILVVLEDERLSSVEANNIMIKHDISRKKRKESVDKVASTKILQRFLDRRKD